MTIVNQHLLQLNCREFTPGDAMAELRLTIDPQLPAESFKISGARTGLDVTGGNQLGLLYGVGKMLRDGSFAEGEFKFGVWRG